MRLIGDILKLAGKTAGEKAIVGAASAVAMAGVSTFLFRKDKESLKKINGKSFGKYAGGNSKMLKEWKSEKAKNKPRRAVKKFFSPVVDAGIKYCEGFEKGMTYLYSNTDMLKPAKAILGVK